ncbi:transcriptional regulator Medusa [Arthroderma uncinatum]|uniref:transcriptional regulator Medusa n=1 Tax=Arthroderma uncinatum TaxID=74035 RepID=UPI00144A58C4|nr:transcriptional regulator Medusa [Arthroderma uncinatum]KAF3482833.1 transcriptional regulator Medusa [Arthroderma uncinatum]
MYPFPDTLFELQSPLIFDESLDFSDPEESRFAGAYSDSLLAKPGNLLSMSALDKAQKIDYLDSDETSNALRETSTLLACPPGSYGTSMYNPMLDGSFISDDDSAHYMSNSAYAGSPFDIRRSPSLESNCNPAPEVTSFSPSIGYEGTKLTIYVESFYDLLNPPTWTFSVVFGSAHCDCTITSLGLEDSKFQYALTVTVPAFVSTACSALCVALQVVLNDQESSTQHIARIGSFTYDQEARQMSPRKRRMSSASDGTSASANSSSVKQMRINDGTKVERLSASPYSPYLPTPSSMGSYSGQYQQVLPAGQYEHQIQLRATAPSPLASSWSPCVSNATATSCSPPMSVTPIAQEPEMNRANPTLVRTSTIQQALAGAPSPNAPFNPYAMYPSKAVLKLNGDLDAMALNWKPEECEAQRRLVQFTRRQEGSTIHADFKPVAPADRVPNSICISCIQWAGKKECYVTSVDTIYLLESLVGVRFTVEEKNRIRRNLEGFRPMTVSKAKPDSEDFFKVIMGFPNPKPRNIEKDVKVFPWKILTHALKKIIGKYSASYSSTAAALPAPLRSNYAGSPNMSSSGIVDVRSGSPAGHQANSMANALPPHTASHLSSSSYMPVMVTSAASHPSLTAAYSYSSLPHRHIQPSPIIVPSQATFDFSAYVGHNQMPTYQSS